MPRALLLQLGPGLSCVEVEPRPITASVGEECLGLSLLSGGRERGRAFSEQIVPAPECVQRVLSPWHTPQSTVPAADSVPLKDRAPGDTSYPPGSRTELISSMHGPAHSLHAGSSGSARPGALPGQCSSELPTCRADPLNCAVWSRAPQGH